MKKTEIFETIKQEWNPAEVPSPRFVAAIDELLQLIEDNNLITPHEILNDNFELLERKIIEDIHDAKEHLRNTMNE